MVDCLAPDQGLAAARSIESLIVMDETGKKAEGTTTVAFDIDTTDSQDVADRSYFKALRRGDSLRFGSLSAKVTKESANAQAAAPAQPVKAQATDAKSPIPAAAAAPTAPWDQCTPNLAAEKSEPALHYTIGQVRSQTDGALKTVFAIQCKPKEKEKPRYLLTATQLFAVLDPVLPDPMQFLVVDLDDPRLPVIFHTNPYRAGTENFADRIEDSAGGVAALRTLGAADGCKGTQGSRAPERRAPLHFAARYDGAMTEFAAMPLACARWAVLVFAARNTIDTVAATTATRSILGWLSIALLTIVGGGLAMIVFRPGLWRDLWPDEADHVVYFMLRDRLQLAAIMLASFVALAAQGALPAWLAGLAALGLWWGSVAWFIRELSRRPQTAKALSPGTERNYTQICLAMLLALSVIPMAAAWIDSRILSRELADTSRATAARVALDDRAEHLRSVLGTSPLRAESESVPIPEGLPGQATRDGRPISAQTYTSAAAITFARALAASQLYLPEPDFLRCAGDGIPGLWLCLHASADRPNQPKTLALVPGRTSWHMSIRAWSLIGFIAAAAAAIIVIAVKLGLEAMMGFGVPLGAVKLQRFDAQKIPKRTLLVGPPTPVRLFFAGKNELWNADLADLFLATPNADLTDDKTKATFLKELDTKRTKCNPPAIGKPGILRRLFNRVPAAPPPAPHAAAEAGLRLIVVGLSLILRDSARRRAALKFLESADRALEEKKLAGIVIISDFSPLERILDAFDNEEPGDAGAPSAREELRWARLFQRFHTKQFSPIEKVKLEDKKIRVLIDKRDRITNADEHATHALIQELRWLPASIIESLTSRSPDLYRLARMLKGQQGSARVQSWFPTDAWLYQAAYTRPVLNWAKRQKMPSPAAAIDYLRTTLIEYYEQCWAAATLSERVVLEAIARGQFVNMKKAIALQALVRRGLVILDPAPRLMNRSFAQFVLQVQRPDSLRKWREKQPKSGWVVARAPVLATILAGGVFLSVGSAQSGQQLSALLALLAAGGPTLIGLAHRVVRPPA